MMHFFSGSVLVLLLAGSLSASAQVSVAKTTPDASISAGGLPCNQIVGKVFNHEGQPLAGATVELQGGKFPFISNSDGSYLIDKSATKGQEVRISAVGFVPVTFTVTGCELADISLELADGTKIKRRGKRAGQVVRYNSSAQQPQP